MIETELPEDGLSEFHQQNLSLLRTLEEDRDVFQLLGTVDYLCLSKIPLSLYDDILNLDPYDVRDVFTSGQWVQTEIMTMQRAWRSKEWCMIAARKSNLDWLEYAQKKGLRPKLQVFQEAARIGDLKVMRWLRFHGYPWDEVVFETAVATGQMDVIEWLFEEKCPRDHYSVTAAVRGKNFPLVQWLCHKKCEIAHHAVFLAVQGDDLDMTRYLIQEMGGPCRSFLATCAARNGNIDMFEFFRARNDQDWAVFKTFNNAILSGKIAMVNHLRTLDCPQHEMEAIECSIRGSSMVMFHHVHSLFPQNKTVDIFHYAALHKNLSVMEWCRDVNHATFALRPFFCTHACRTGDLHMLKWLKDHGCPWAKQRCLKIAKDRYPSISDYIESYGRRSKK